MAMCPLECVNAACSPPDFIERNGTWLLTLIGVAGGGMGAILTYFLKSRCTRIDLCCLKCRRDPLTQSAISEPTLSVRGDTVNSAA